MADDGDSFAIAREHYAWARGQGFSDDEILASVGIRRVMPTDPEEVVWYLERAHWRLLSARREKAA